MDLPDATWTDADAAGTDLALLPVGSTEQHGPHAPLSTDILIAEAVADAAAAAYDDEVVVAPPFPYGVSEEHRAFRGTLWLSPETFRSALRDVTTSLIHNGWRRVIYVNGHGGNIEALDEVAADVSRHEDGYAVAFTWFNAIGEHAAKMGHAGPLETAMLRAHYPGLVHEDRVEAARDGASGSWGDWTSGVNLAHDTDEFTDNGVVGDPSAGDAALGHELTDLAADGLAELLDAVADRSLD